MTETRETRFRAMGSNVHVVVIGGPTNAPDRAEARIRQLESRWSRFLVDSEVTSLNRAAGQTMSVSADTVLLLSAAREGWSLTGGAFDPTVRHAVIAAGYPTADAGPDGPFGPGNGCASFEIDPVAGTIRLPVGVTVDPGGIGKGLAADVVVGELINAGSVGAMVNIGGDLRVAGQSPHDDGWRIDVEDPFEPSLTIWSPVVADGGIATSSTLTRQWRFNGEDRHHLIDPETGLPPRTTNVAATVVAGMAWIAEVYTKVAMARSGGEAISALDDAGVTGVVVDSAGELWVNARIGAYL